MSVTLAHFKPRTGVWVYLRTMHMSLNERLKLLQEHMQPPSCALHMFHRKAMQHVHFPPQIWPWWISLFDPWRNRTVHGNRGYKWHHDRAPYSHCLFLEFRAFCLTTNIWDTQKQFSHSPSVYKGWRGKTLVSLKAINGATGLLVMAKRLWNWCFELLVFRPFYVKLTVAKTETRGCVCKGACNLDSWVFVRGNFIPKGLSARFWESNWRAIHHWFSFIWQTKTPGKWIRGSSTK